MISTNKQTNKHNAKLRTPLAAADSTINGMDPEGGREIDPSLGFAPIPIQFQFPIPIPFVSPLQVLGLIPNCKHCVQFLII